MIDEEDVLNLSRQVDAVGEFASSMLGDMAVDRGGQEDRALNALTERIDDTIERHAELVRSLSDGSQTSRLTLSRMSADYPSRSRAFMGMRDLLNDRFNDLAVEIASDPLDAARCMVHMQSSYLRLSNLFDDVFQARGANRTRSHPISIPVRSDEIRSRRIVVTEPANEASNTQVCSICFDACVGTDETVSCATCNKRVHSTCLTGYRRSAGPDVPCPTCRRSFS